MSTRTVRLLKGETVKFSDLPSLIADAMHADEDSCADDVDACSIAELAFEDELKRRVDAGELTVRDPLTLAEQSFPLGNVLANSVLTADDLRPLLEAKGIALIIESPKSLEGAMHRERVRAVDLIQEQSTLWERQQPARLFDGPGFTQEALALTTLSKYEEFETWTPEMAVLLVSGIQAPYPACTEIPERGAMGLDNCFIMGDHDPFHQARYILELWRSRENPPLRVRPLDFIDWCETKGIDTGWLRFIKEMDRKEKAQQYREAAQGATNLLHNPVRLPNASVVTVRRLADEIAYALVKIPDDEILIGVMKETLVEQNESGSTSHLERLTDDNWQLVRKLCGGNPPPRCSREQFAAWRELFDNDPGKPRWDLHPNFNPSNEMIAAQQMWCSIVTGHMTQIERKVKSRELTLVTVAGIETTDTDAGLLRIADAKAYLDACCMAWEDTPDSKSESVDAGRGKSSAQRQNGPDGDYDWKEAAISIANKIGQRRWDGGQEEITARNVVDAVAKELKDDPRSHGNKGARSSSTIRTQALKGWKFVPSPPKKPAQESTGLSQDPVD